MSSEKVLTESSKPNAPADGAASKAAERRKVPGLPDLAPPTQGGKKRRSKKTSTLPGISALPDTVTSSDAALETLASVTSDAPAPAAPATTTTSSSKANGLHLDSLPVVNEEQAEEDKRVSPITVIQKRIKAHTKKLVRLLSSWLVRAVSFAHSNASRPMRTRLRSSTPTSSARSLPSPASSSPSRSFKSSSPSSRPKKPRRSSVSSVRLPRPTVA
jgi:hypothetical protein